MMMEEQHPGVALSASSSSSSSLSQDPNNQDRRRRGDEDDLEVQKRVNASHCHDGGRSDPSSSRTIPMYEKDHHHELTTSQQLLLELKQQQLQLLNATRPHSTVRRCIYLFAVVVLLFFIVWAGTVTAMTTYSTQVYDMRHKELSHDKMKVILRQWHQGRTIVLKHLSYARDKEISMSFSPHSSGSFWVTMKDSDDILSDVEYTYYDGGNDREVARFSCYYGNDCSISSSAQSSN
eukprot:CAMPEP_0119557638 /NCGR_PEP_ID=MMETSP1352-20130426/9251_1 /TAXON_ID=265584 /ORGANISM="Stauroneis constricta, Strain CCMP1120" /LENGTH=234 /DNA_ID=CAMNT_0007604775 /DNA_START=75 /DNA_END=779 /DNA_ORIENTATION=+